MKLATRVPLAEYQRTFPINEIVIKTIQSSSKQTEHAEAVMLIWIMCVPSRPVESWDMVDNGG